MRVTLIDAHHHLWDLSLNPYPWLQSHHDPHFFLGNYDNLKHNYLWPDYLKDSEKHRVIATVHCEAEWDRNDQVGETRWLMEVHAQTQFPTAIVAHAWFHTPHCEDTLARQAAYPLVRGIRSKPVTASSPSAMQRGLPGSMQDPNWLKGFALLEKYSLSWDLRVPYWHLEEASAVAKMFPRTPIVLNHTGFPWDRSAEGLRAWRKAMTSIAQCHNVWLKVSEFGLKDAAWSFEDNQKIVKEALSIFGIERCMFGSNFPVAKLRTSYTNLVDSVAAMIQDYTDTQQHGFFVRNAAVFYKLDIPEVTQP